MVQKTEAIKNFLTHMTHADLARLYSLDMECQVNVAQDNGQRIEGDFKGRMWHGWSDGLTTWKSFRIPHNAATEPEYTDSEMRFDLAKHAEGIGMTGWDWKNKLSRWVAFDFDSIIGHEKEGLNSEELKKIEEKAFSLPWVTIRKSTSGNGLHLYVFLNPAIPTQNHNEHAALARSILGTMAAETGYDFINKADICGGNMWVWHRKMVKSNGEGLKKIKEGRPFNRVQENWRDHVKVITGRTRKVIPEFIEQQEISDADRMFMELTGQYIKEKLDDDHLKLLEYLRQNNCMWQWDQDNNMLITHTAYLKKAHDDLGLKGIFDTISTGKEWGRDINCFAFPLRRGGWVVRRFTPGVREHETWDQDGSGWSRTYLNVEPDLPTAARNHEGIEHPSGGYVFRTAEQAQRAAEYLGADLKLPNWVLSRKAKLKEHKDGRLIVEITKENEDDPRQMEKWLPEKGTWKRIFNVQLTTPKEVETSNYDDLIRHIVTEQNQDCGWVIKSDGDWTEEPMTHVKFALKSMGLNDRDVNNVLGSNVFKKWRIVNKPFQPEYPGDRRWNRDACQLLFLPSKDDTLHFPTWKKILYHVGRGLNEAMSQNKWAKDNGILTGSDYLKCWIASIFQFPARPLPYLFLYGPEASGKSMLHEAISLLISRTGYQRADQALLSQQGFNGELKNAVLCIIEERNLEKNRQAYNRIKDWVTSPLLPVHPKGGTPYLTENTTHWIQCANDIHACPVFPGDTRITMILVDSIPQEDWESKVDLENKLRKEAPDFLGELIKLEIPPSPDRLNIPVISTSEKETIQKQNQNALELFIEEQCHYVPGYMLKLSEFYDKFIAWCDPGEAYNWSKMAVGRNLPYKFVKGRRKEDGQFYIGNIAWTPNPEGAEGLPELVLREEKLCYKTW